jgi:hypothetical protein
VLASDPRKNALLKAGNKSDRIDARKLSELLQRSWKPAYAVVPNSTTSSSGNDLCGRSGFAREFGDGGDSRNESRDDSLKKEPGLPGWTATQATNELQNHGEQGIRTLKELARSYIISGSTKTSGHEITAADSYHWPHPCRSVDRSDTDA